MVCASTYVRVYVAMCVCVHVYRYHHTVDGYYTYSNTSYIAIATVFNPYIFQV